jgi:hypothetical protein
MKVDAELKNLKSSYCFEKEIMTFNEGVTEKKQN